jgi:colanic acid biosynthesis glycosyl transferase WcaI
MRVLMINQVFHPDVAATAQHAHDLGRHLVAHGYDVAVIASRSIYGERGASLPKFERVDGIEVHRVGQSIFGKAGILARAFDFACFDIAATLKAFTIKRPDVVICFTTPPFIALLGWLLRLVRRTRFVYWVMDLYPDVPVECGVMKARSPITRCFELLNRFLLRRADRTVVLGRCMRERVLGKGIPETRVVHIGVWSDESEVKPLPPECNPYRKEWELGERFVVMYSGNFGLGHDVDTMLQAALRLRHDDSIRFAFVGGGKKKPIVDRFVREHALTNCIVAPYQPREKLDASLSCGDAHLATLALRMQGAIVPCKLFGSMAAERPTIFIGPPGSELARVLTEHNCGIVVPPGDVDGLVRAIRELAADPQRRHEMGERARNALGQTYSREKACEQWRRLLEDMAGHDVK